MQWEESVKALVDASIQGVSLSNNHMTDFGGAAVANTRKVLQKHGIDIAGLTNGIKPPYGKQVPILYYSIAGNFICQYLSISSIITVRF